MIPQQSDWRTLWVAATLLAITAAVPALAQGTAEQRSDCMGDAFKFCSAFIPSESEIEACLIKNIDQLTPACRGEFAGAEKKTKIRKEHFK